MPWDRRVATVVELRGAMAVLEFEDGERWNVVVPDDVDARVGMAALAIDTGADSPLIGWGA
jgi:hypothetical protein